MSGLRFKVGELAILQFTTDQSAFGCEGDRVEIYAAGPFKPGDTVMIGREPAKIGKAGDYVIRWSDDSGGICFDWQLRKIDSPAEPASLTRESECGVEVS
jgi:hypothetical protein